MDLSIIIINWNSKDFLKNCLESIKKSNIKVRYEVLVIDNASYDGCKSLVNNSLPNIRFIQSETNLGFAKANNLGYHHSNGEFLLFLNPDTIIIGSAIDRMYRLIKSNPKIGIVGPCILNPDKSIQISSLHNMPTPFNQMIESNILKKQHKAYRSFINKNTNPFMCEAVSGACLLIRKEVFNKIGLFSNEYFMYSEDIDLCYKVIKANGLIYYCPEAQILHFGGTSTEKSSSNHFNTIMRRQSRIIFFKKNNGMLIASLYLILQVTSAIARITVCSILYLPLFFTSKKISCLQSIKKWSKVISWALGNEKWINQYTTKNR